MKILKIKKTPEATIIKKAVGVLERDGLIIYPTETVYGLGADASSLTAVNRVLELKGQRDLKPISIAVADQQMAEQYVKLNNTAKNLYRQFLPGPLTIISKKRERRQMKMSVSKTSARSHENHQKSAKGQGDEPLSEERESVRQFTHPKAERFEKQVSNLPAKLAPGIASPDDTIGIRIPDYPLVTKIIKQLDRPITATSANAAYQKRPYQISDVIDNLSVKKKRLIDLVIDAGRLPRREPSTVIDTTLDDPVVLRQGEIKLKAENEIISRSEADTQNLGKELWQKYGPRQGKKAIIFALEGPLGVGKTQFTKGLARALGITQPIRSPSYTLVKEYKLPINFFHIDVWRLASPRELATLMPITDKKLPTTAVFALEWADRVADSIRKFDQLALIIWIKLNFGPKENERVISWGVL